MAAMIGENWLLALAAWTFVVLLAGYRLGARRTSDDRRGGLSNPPPPAPPRTPVPEPAGDLRAEIEASLRAGHKIQAIKALRTETGQGLAEAKAEVERIEAAMRRG